MFNSFLKGQEEARASGLEVLHVLGAEDVRRALRDECDFGALISIEGGEALCGCLGALEAFWRFGVRAMGLVWNHRNELADGVADGASGGGLTPFGKEVVRAMEAMGMAVDVSHLSDAGFWDVSRISRRPFYASHSNARALCDHPRNLTDDQIRAVADSGGVIGVNFYASFLHASGRAGIEDVIEHIEYLADRAGIDHVALGSDFDGIDRAPEGLEDVSKMPALAEALRTRGWEERDVRAVLGENLARFLTQVLL